MNFDHIGVVNNELTIYNRGNLVGMGVNIYKITRRRRRTLPPSVTNCSRKRRSKKQNKR